MKTNFYDIESLDNVFTLCNFKNEDNSVDIYYLIDTPEIYNFVQTNHETFLKTLKQAIYAKNPNFSGEIKLFDLKTKTANDYLAITMGVSDAPNVNDPNSQSTFPKEFRPICDTDTEIYTEDKYPYIFGYNSFNYDSTILAQYFNETYAFQNVHDQLGDICYDITSGQAIVERQFKAITAHEMRQFNDELFLDKYKGNMPNRLLYNMDDSSPDWNDPRRLIRQNFIRSNRHIDVAMLNEKQRKVGLKRLLGNLGYQILESDKLSIYNNIIHNITELYELIAYNVSDVVNLKELFTHPYYKSQFELKKGLLIKYPELIYEQDGDTYKPKIDKQHVRKDRLTINSSSAQFATMALCPYGYLIDDEVVSFNYPSARKAKEEGIPQVNVLEETKKFFYKNFAQFPHLTKKFDQIYNYYKSIEGKNFNDSANYLKHYAYNYSNLPLNPKTNQPDYSYLNQLPDRLQPYDIYKIPKHPNNLFYYYKDGTPSSCFVTFSVGGIHGQEANLAQFEKDYRAWQKQANIMEEVKQLYPDPLTVRQLKTITLPSSNQTYAWKDLIKSGISLKAMQAMSVEERMQTVYRDYTNIKPRLFDIAADGSTELNKAKYAYTSYAHVNHEDFTSYYPNLLRMMEAFYNKGLGYDRYGEIFAEKERFGKLRKDKNLTPEQRAFYDNQRNGTKLILNSASGAANAKFDNAIKMSNKIIAMRVIGQLYTYTIGQAQTLANAKIISTNTDGLYSVMDEKENNLILAKTAKDIHVQIEPEPLYLISKDTNNRLEMNDTNGKVLTTAGGSLSCYKDTSPLASLTHPAIIDWALGEYLILASYGYKASMNQKFNRELGKIILEKSFEKFDTIHLLRMYQNVIASSIGSVTYNFAIDPNDPEKTNILQHYNRTFIMKDHTPHCMHLMAATQKKITPATIQKRKHDNMALEQHDDLALRILSGNGIDIQSIPFGYEAAIKKITNIETNWFMYIENHSLFYLSDAQIDFIKQNLDLEKYLNLFQDAFEKNWMNNISDDQLDNYVTMPEIYLDV